MTRRASRFLLLALLAVLILACGRAGRPIPPGKALLEPPPAPALVGTGEAVTLTWQRPYSTVGGKRAPAPEAYLVEKSIWLDGDSSCETCADEVVMAARIEAEQLRLEGGDPERWSDADLHPGEAYGYRVIPVDGDGRPGLPSPFSSIRWLAVQMPVVTAEGADKSVSIKVTPPAAANGSTPKGLAVYDEAGKLVLQLPAGSAEGVVTGLENGVPVTLSCRWSVVTPGGWQLQSAAVQVTATPTDLSEPEPPREVVAFGGRGEVTLNWLPPHREKCKALVIERRGLDEEAQETGWQELTKLTGSEASKVSYPDRDIEPGNRYGYRLFCEDAAGNRSAPSPEARARSLKAR